MDDIIAKVMATFFEALEHDNVTAYPALKAEYHWWAMVHLTAPHKAEAGFGKVLVSPIGIYIPNDSGLDIFDPKTEQHIMLPEGVFWLSESDVVRSDIQTYFENTVKGIQ